jgi:iron-sulfur cluster repair protein YtfE (RIC family)
MRRPFALGTLTREHRVMVHGGAHDRPDGLLGSLDRVATTTLIERLLEPQHAALRSALRGLHALTLELARHDRSPDHLLRRVAGMLDELADLMLDQLEHEERSVFPFLRAGVAPLHVLAELHDHHDEVAVRVRCLRALVDELPAVGTDREHAALVDGLRGLDELARAHRELERQALLARYA